MTTDECNGLTGRRLQICNGTSGLPEDVRRQYMDLWQSKRGRNAVETARGLGDWIAAGISTITFGMVHSTKDCGCEKRRQFLNKLGEGLASFFKR